VPRAPTAIHLAMGFATAPSLPQLKRFVADSARPIQLRELAMLEVAARTSKRITWLRSVADSPRMPTELREFAKQWIALIQLYRGGRALVRRFGLW